jgi:outer membrane protein OmpA-like peptidoglycan-associated protein
MNARILLLSTLAVATLSACSSIPNSNTALDQARLRVQSIQADPQVAALAPDETKRASDSLRTAEKAWAEEVAPATVSHLSYMTVQRVVIAQETAMSRASQAVTAGAAAERDKMRLAQRTNEADAAQQQLAMAERSNNRKTAELAAADASAARTQARNQDLETQLKDLNAKQTDRGIVVTLGDVLFNTGQSQLMPEGARNMTKLADVFKRNPQRRASIEGYTDNVGGSGANLELSQRRANTVMTALVNQGVNAGHLSTRAHGEQNPAADNTTLAGRQMNRRVEIVFAPEADAAGAK